VAKNKMKTIKEWTEDVEKTKMDLISWAYNSKRYGNFWERNWVMFFMYGLLFSFMGLFYCVGWFFFFNTIKILANRNQQTQ